MAKQAKLIHPTGGRKIETAGMPVSTEPIPGGVCIINGSLPVGTEGHTVWRELSADEKRERKRFVKEGPMAAMGYLRIERNRRLADSDWTQQPDAPLTATKKRVWTKYRQALRDLPANTKDPYNPDWPETPQ